MGCVHISEAEFTEGKLGLIAQAMSQTRIAKARFDKDILNIETEYKKNLEQLTFERRGHR
jgi:hypothetical protein